MPLQLDDWHIDEAHTQITLLVSSIQVEARRPACDTSDRHVHSGYTRTLANLPWGGDGITWQLRVRRLFCRGSTCPRRIFSK